LRFQEIKRVDLEHSRRKKGGTPQAPNPANGSALVAHQTAEIIDLPPESRTVLSWKILV